ncbi:hypothetical protein [Actinophytocola sp. NPDC049390]|uniref:hypothetical protein n=1 Tax=Actinophytocola sp. NPDC049390 TaxID=3363894 RepID=UPI0037873A12
MNDYTWPDKGVWETDRVLRAWPATVADFPVGAPVAGEVVGRQPFGVFIRVDDAPDTVALAEITAMPRGAELPSLGDRVTGEVVWHTEHNHQVKVRLVER